MEYIILKNMPETPKGGIIRHPACGWLKNAVCGLKSLSAEKSVMAAKIREFSAEVVRQI